MATVSLGVVIDTANTSIIGTDTSDYAGQGIALADVVGNIEVLVNGVQFYDNGSIVRYSATAQSGSSTTIQLASGASAVNGFYQGLWVRITSGTGVGQKRQVVSYSGTSKTCVVAAWGTAPDNTSVYEFTFADIYVVSSLVNQRRIALPLQNGEIMQGLYTFNYTVYDQNTDDYYTSTSSINIDFTFPTVDLTYTVDCLTPLLESTDSTDYTIQGATASVTRTHTVQAPANVDPTVYTGADVTIQVPQFYAPTLYQATLSSSVVWDFGGGVTVSALLTGQQPINTYCDNWVCDMFCCINNLYQQWVSLQQTNSGQSAYYFRKWELGVLIIDMIKSAYSCGQNTVVNGLINQFYIETGCTANCNCSNNNAPTLVQGLGLANATQYSLLEGDSYIDVTTVTGANSVAWTLSLSPTALALLLSNPTLTGLVNITVANPSAGVYEITGATVTDGVGVRVSTTSSGGVIIDYNVALANLLESNLGDDTNAGTSYETLRTYTLPAGQLLSEGDVLRIKATYFVTANNSAKNARVQFNGTTLFSAYTADIATVSYLEMNFEVVRLSVTTVGVVARFARLNALGSVVDTVGTPYYAAPYTANNLDSLTNVINFQADGAAIGDMNLQFNQIEIVKK